MCVGLVCAWSAFFVVLCDCDSLLHISVSVSMLITFHTNECAGRQLGERASARCMRLFTLHTVWLNFPFQLLHVLLRFMGGVFWGELYAQLLKIALFQIVAQSTVHATRSNFTILDGCSTPMAVLLHCCLLVSSLISLFFDCSKCSCKNSAAPWPSHPSRIL